MDMLRSWFRRTFSDPQVVILVGLLLVFSLAVLLMARILAPVIASVVLAFLLHPLVRLLLRAGIPHLAAVSVIFLLFFALLMAVLFLLLPNLFGQLTQMVQQLPLVMQAVQTELMRLPERYPQIVSEEEISQFVASVRTDLVAMGQRIVAHTFASLMGAVTLAVYAILVPFLVFFFLKDGQRILAWLGSFLPHDRELANAVWKEILFQISNYVRGKAVEIVIVAVVTFAVFTFLGLNYAALLAVITGLSVLIPYVGAAVVTLPVALVAFAQWGLGPEFVYVMIAYGIIQGLDGNVLAPLLLGDAVNIHPVAIIVAILFFGSLWGFWGVFFAIPLATVVHAVIKSWPRAPRGQESPGPAAS